jgi:hypothetical protein
VLKCSWQTKKEQHQCLNFWDAEICPNTQIRTYAINREGGYQYSSNSAGSSLLTNSTLERDLPLRVCRSYMHILVLSAWFRPRKGPFSTAYNLPRMHEVHILLNQGNKKQREVLDTEKSTFLYYILSSSRKSLLQVRNQQSHDKVSHPMVSI